jgi:hypothetical protein
MKKIKNPHLLWVAVATVAVVMPLRQAVLADQDQAPGAVACSAPAGVHGLLEAACTLQPANHQLGTVRRPAAARPRLWV